MLEHSINNESEDSHDDMGGFKRDQSQLSRRRLFGLFGGISTAALLAACSDSITGDSITSTSTSSTSSTPNATGLTASAGTQIPNETQGPFPADGSNGPNVLKDGAVIRKDLTTSFGEFSGTAAGVPAQFTLMIVDAATGATISGAAVYAWHCTADGRYSIYEIADQNYLRGLQTADNLGIVSFDSVFPGCYNGRWPHVHFEIFNSLADATSGASARKISQLAIPEASCQQAYQDSAYGNSVTALAAQTLTSDNVFADGWTEQLATVSGSNSDGWNISLVIRV